jgi:hypothetical protein
LPKKRNAKAAVAVTAHAGTNLVAKHVPKVATRTPAADAVKAVVAVVTGAAKVVVVAAGVAGVVTAPPKASANVSMRKASRWWLTPVPIWPRYQLTARKHLATSNAPNVHPATQNAAKAATAVSVVNAAAQSVLKTAIGRDKASAVSRVQKAVTSVVLNAIAVRMRTSVPTK